MQTNTTVVRVAFQGYNKQMYDYKTNLELQEGDFVVVEGAGQLQVVEVKEINVNSNKATKWVIQKVDLEGWKARVNREQEITKVKRKMAARKKQLDESKQFEFYAESDGTMKELLEELRKLEDSVDGKN